MEATRTCLKCDSPFDSWGPANRICPGCDRINARIRGITEAALRKQRGLKRHNGEIISDLAPEPALSE